MIAAAPETFPKELVDFLHFFQSQSPSDRKRFLFKIQSVVDGPIVTPDKLHTHIMTPDKLQVPIVAPDKLDEHIMAPDRFQGYTAAPDLLDAMAINFPQVIDSASQQNHLLNLRVALQSTTISEKDKRAAMTRWISSSYIDPFVDVMNFCVVEARPSSATTTPASFTASEPKYVNYHGHPRGRLPQRAIGDVIKALEKLQQRFVDASAFDDDTFLRRAMTTSSTRPRCWAKSEESATYCALLLDRQGKEQFYVGKSNEGADRWDRSNGHIASMRDYLSRKAGNEDAKKAALDVDKALALIPGENVYVYILGNSQAEGYWERNLLEQINHCLGDAYYKTGPLTSSSVGLNGKSGCAPRLSDTIKKEEDTEKILDHPLTIQTAF